MEKILETITFAVKDVSIYSVEEIFREIVNSKHILDNIDSFNIEKIQSQY